MSDTRDPADEQQIVDVPEGSDPQQGAAPAIDPAGMGQETGDVPAELDDEDTSSPSPDVV